MTRAAGVVGMARITHHDLRHFFATVCIESGVDIPTVSRWLGHKTAGRWRCARTDICGGNTVLPRLRRCHLRPCRRQAVRPNDELFVSPLKVPNIFNKPTVSTDSTDAAASAFLLQDRINNGEAQPSAVGRMPVACWNLQVM
jgi:hypothetical protein